MFTDLPEEQALYHSIATVGTLLLQIGEAGKISSGGEMFSPDVEKKIVSSFGSEDTGNRKESESAQDTKNAEPNNRRVKGAEGDSVLSRSEENQGFGEGAEQTAGTVATEPLTRPTELPVVHGDSKGGYSKNISRSDDDWSVSFKQLLASMLTEPPLVDYFERVYDTTDAVAALRNCRLARVSTTHDSKS